MANYELKNVRDDKINKYRSFQDLIKIRGIHCQRVIFYNGFKLSRKELYDFILPLSHGYGRNYWQKINGKLKKIKPENFLLPLDNNGKELGFLKEYL